MSGAQRKVFGAEFKAKVGLEAIHGVQTINQIAQEHGVHPAQVGQWKKEILERAGSLFEGKRGPRAMNEYSELEWIRCQCFCVTLPADSCIGVMLSIQYPFTDTRTAFVILVASYLTP